MKLEREYGANYDFKHYKLIPQSIEECAICVELASNYPKIFEISVNKGYCQPYEMILIIKRGEESNER